MKLSSAFLSIALAATSTGVTKASLGPGYEDQIYCPVGHCEIYFNPFGYAGPASMYYKCFDPTTKEMINGVWTGSLTNTTPPEGWTQPQMCDADQYSPCDTAEQCTLLVSVGCSCYVSSTIIPFDLLQGDASCTGNECDGYEAVCSQGLNGGGNTCMIDFPDVAAATSTVATPATATSATSAAGNSGNTTTGGGATFGTVSGSNPPVPNPSPSSGHVASVTILLFFVSAAAVLGCFP